VSSREVVGAAEVEAVEEAEVLTEVEEEDLVVAAVECTWEVAVAGWVACTSAAAAWAA
jgi:hypothetical protein